MLGWLLNVRDRFIRMDHASLEKKSTMAMSINATFSW